MNTLILFPIVALVLVLVGGYFYMLLIEKISILLKRTPKVRNAVLFIGFILGIIMLLVVIGSILMQISAVVFNF